MKPLTIFTALLVLLLISCNSANDNNNKPPETPKALVDKTATYDVIDKRSDDNMLEDLYEELANKTPNLKELAKDIDNLNTSKLDSSKLYNDFNAKNEAYYNIVNGRIAEGIKDSLLRHKMRLLIANSLQKYNTSIAKHTALLNAIDSSSLTVNDLYTALKITKTLPIIELYQQQHLPSTKPLEGYLQQQQIVIKQLDGKMKH